MISCLLSPHGHRPCLFLVFVSLIILVVQSQEPPLNHSLITYNQYSTLLNQAPQCFRTGCGQNDTLTTASSSCSAQSPCYGLWTIINDRFQKDWCDLSPNDIACRIPGWPILNSTSICDLVPNEWIFGVSGQCCIANDEPFDFANWIGDMCNGQWKEPFTIYGGMAKEDWQEWIVPWNWTVRPENTASEAIDSSRCPSASQELGLFAAENIIFAIISIIVPYVTWALHRKRLRQKERTGIKEDTGIMAIAKMIMAGVKSFWDAHFRNTFGELATIQWIIVGTLSAGGQIGFNFLTSAIIKRTPGYEHVPLTQLAVLHGTRPRLGWALCVLNLIDHEIFANAAASFGLSELILQCFGSKYFGVTANKGTQREFYHIHILRPFWHGRAAYRMYIGALLWLLGCFAIIISWLCYVFLQVQFLIYVGKLKKWEQAKFKKVKKWLKPKNSEKTHYSDLVGRRRPVSRLKNMIPNKVLVLFRNLNEWTKKTWWKRDPPVLETQYTTLTPTPKPVDKYQRIREKSVFLVLLVGLCSYSAQWIFWDGFVKTAGSRSGSPIFLT